MLFTLKVKSPKLVVTNGNISQHFIGTENGKITVFRNGTLHCEKPFNKGAFYLNLPLPGHYSFSGFGFDVGNQTPLIKSILDISLPQPERVRKFGINDIHYDNNSNSPARIYSALGVIVLNPKFDTYANEIKLFILLHEVGHFYYKTEWKCDMYAAYHFINTFNCNPTQAFESLAGVLHDTKPDGTPHEINNDRIKRIYNLLSK